MMSTIKETSRFRDKGLSVFNDNLVLPRHRWYTFKEGFSETLVRDAVDISLSGSKRKLRILDPFAGSGTTIVSAGRLGHHATGIELNPFLKFAGEAKCGQPAANLKDFSQQLSEILKASATEIRSPLEGQSTFTKRAGLGKWLFNTSVLRGFTSLDEAISRLAHPSISNSMRLGLFASLMKHCNARRDGKCLRYRVGWEKLGYTSNDLRTDFKTKAEEIFTDLSESKFESKGLEIRQGDVRKKLREMRASSFDLIVTSPPYLNSFDYSDLYRPELFLGGFVRSNDELRAIRKSTIRSHVQHVWDEPNPTESPRLIKILADLRGKKLWSNQIPTMVAAYFEDMRLVLQELVRVIRKGGKAWLVVSTSAYGGIEIPVDLILADIGEEVGWKLESINVLRRLKSSTQHSPKTSGASRMPLRESLIILER